MKKEVLISLSVIGLMTAGSVYAEISCTTPPSCDTLGFDKTAVHCEGQSALKCPFDQSKLYCPDIVAMANVEPGAIYYSDGTISDIIIPSRTPVGVVAYVNGRNGFVVALEEASKEWGTDGNNVPCLPDLKKSDASSDINGKTNTQCLLNDTQSHPAAEYCNSFKPVSSGKGSSGWYLPAAGELYSMSFNYEVINLKLQELSKTKISPDFYWSSSETYDYNVDAWSVELSDGFLADYYGKGNSKPVRCILAF